MANKSVLELAVETGKWDSGLKKAKSALDKFTDASGGLQKALDADSEKMGKFVQMMGKADSTAKTGKGQMNDYKQAIEQLTMQFNRMTDAQKKTVGQDYLNAIEKLKEKYRGVSDEIQKMNQSLVGSGSSSSGGGLFGGGKMSGMLQVFGGNLMTKAAGWAASFASEMGQAVQQGIELARQGEGIRNAFERLGRGDILNGLREATHGTVTDLELMKAAVKFNDFKLPLDELGTMLAFAQQKAKDTGQSVDYMVESITNGLGRQSKPILDNLGISAKEIEERMKSTGDFTKAVGEIVREQMTKAGDYIETAADRATKADVDLKNAMEDLGRTFQPLTDSATSMWTSIKVSALDLLNSAVRPLIDALTTAGRLRKELANMNGGGNGQPSFVDRQISALAGSNYKNYRFNAALGNYNSQIAGIQNELASRQTGSNVRSNGQYVGVHSQVLQDRLKALQTMRAEYVKRAKEILNPRKISEDVEKDLGGDGTGGTSGGGGSTTTKSPFELLKERTNRVDYSQFYTAITNRNDEIELPVKPTIVKQSPEELKAELDAMYPVDNPYELPVKVDFKIEEFLKKDAEKKLSKMQTAAQMAADAVSNIGSAFASIEDPSAKAAGTVLQAIASIALGFAQAASAKDTTSSGWAWLGWLAAGTAALATTISTVHSLTGFEHGGEIKGNSFSGDNTPIMANAGEVVLTRAMAGNIASQLQGSGNNVHVTGELRGESIFLAVNRSLKRRGKGELVTWG